jgi:putative Holliday junction resolvase
MTSLAELVSELGADRVVVGLPLTLAGQDSQQTREARRFAARLERRLSVPVELFDERFTTVLAQRTPEPRTSEDSRAAAHLLNGWLDARRERRNTKDDG